YISVGSLTLSIFSWYKSSKPTIVVAHVAFKGAALAYYFLANWLSSSFIVQFLIILTLLSMDFWTVKNITGRLLVGLRWWNFVDENGNNHWKFESAKDQSRFCTADRRAFWFGLVRILIVIWPCWFFNITWEWMIVALLGLSMNSANLYGYLRCRWADTNQFTSYISKWAFLSVSFFLPLSSFVLFSL
uniref:Golgi apparatus membrane protein TVP23 homolog n=1 Tax=Angiostrongylus cantonensis TaxID=6313 RepID=A0A158PB41_ANGCA